MWLWYDWRAAAIVNQDGLIIDIIEWSKPEVKQATHRIDAIRNGGLTDEAEVLAQRFPEATICLAGSDELPEADYPAMTAQLNEIFEEAALGLAELGLSRAAGDADRRLEHLQKAMTEVRDITLSLESRLVEWVGLFLPQVRFERNRTQLASTVSQSDGLADLAHKLGVEAPEVEPETSEWRSLKGHAQSAMTFRGQLDRMEAAVRTIAESHLPSLSALLGPLLASKLCVSAHGRERLARLPSGTLQVLGAEKAFFSHLKTGTPPPKHGHIFSHPWISKSPYWVRGKISRTLAAKASIAARVDAYDGQPWGQEQVSEVESRVNEIKSSHPKPPRK